VAGGIIVLTLVIASAAAPLIAPYDPNAQDLLHAYAHPSGAHWLGTDQIGRDVLSRLIFAGRVDLLTAFLAVLIPFILGTILGLLSGYYGRLADTAVMRLVDVMVAFPFFVLVSRSCSSWGRAALDHHRHHLHRLGLVYAHRARRGARTQASRVRAGGARGGLSDSRIMVRHLLPNVITQAIVFSMSDIVLSMLAIVTLSYLGAGIPPPTADWGSMIADGEA
jgi:peptide/nickel transport system permease protein